MDKNKRIQGTASNSFISNPQGAQVSQDDV
jgi:hypothetical protein